MHGKYLYFSDDNPKRKLIMVQKNLFDKWPSSPSISNTLKPHQLSVSCNNCLKSGPNLSKCGKYAGVMYCVSSMVLLGQSIYWSTKKAFSRYSKVISVDRPLEVTARGEERGRAYGAPQMEDDALRIFKLRLNFIFCSQASTTFYRDCKILKIIIWTLYICINAGKIELLNLIASVCRYSSIAAESPPKQTLSCFLLCSKSALILNSEMKSSRHYKTHSHS